MQAPQVVSLPESLKHLMVSKLLDWPFLLFVLVIVVGFRFGQEIVAVLRRGDITLAWGERSIRLRDLSQSFDKEIDPIRDDIDGLKRAVTRLEAQGVQIDHPQPSLPETAATSAARNDLQEETKRRLREALQSPKFSWRSIDRLAAIAAVEESVVLDVLRSDPEVIFSLGKSGRQLAGLRSRVRPDAG